MKGLFDPKTYQKIVRLTLQILVKTMFYDILTTSLGNLKTTLFSNKIFNKV